MAQMLRVARLYFVLLGVVTAGRLAMGAFGVPYARGTGVFSVVILTVYACLFYGAFLRRYRDYRLLQTALLGGLMGLAGQALILAITLACFGLGVDTYFNHPVALNSATGDPVSFGRALVVRLWGLVANTISAGIIAVVGWALGAFLPER